MSSPRTPIVGAVRRIPAQRLESILGGYPEGLRTRDLLPWFKGYDLGDLICALNSHPHLFVKHDDKWRSLSTNEELVKGTKLRPSTLHKVLVDRPSGMSLERLHDRLGQVFSKREIMLVVRTRPRHFTFTDGRVRSRRAGLEQHPPSLASLWNDAAPLVAVDEVSAGPEKLIERRDKLREHLREPMNTFTSMRTAVNGEDRIWHVDHTLISGIPGWVIWSSVADRAYLARLDNRGFHVWEPAAPDILEDVNQIVNPLTATGPGPLIATWVGRSPLSAANTIAVFSVLMFGRVLDEEIALSAEPMAGPAGSDVSRASSIIRQRRSTRQRGQVITFCHSCGRPLYDPNSAALGVGPECATRLGGSVYSLLHKASAVQHWLGAAPTHEVLERMRRPW